MKKEPGWPYWAGLAVMLFGAGAAWSPLFSNAITSAKTVFEVVSYISTAVAGVAAVATLFAWKRQFLTQDHYSGVKRLRVAYWGLRKISTLLTDYAFYHSAWEGAQEKGGEVNEVLSQKLDESYAEWASAQAAYLNAWLDVSASFSDRSELDKYSPYEIKKIYPGFKNKVRQAAFVSDDVFAACCSVASKEKLALDEYFLVGDKLIVDLMKGAID
ncbi:hypothetical protein SAMN05216229_10279 [Geopseudomonas sagittaria]|uniref:Uncharacterized protein n=1 Tax=Geopseudomonas sagittaria TaxID=1135990 RepID=A0A1I5PY65_9GAMM|nr:hypothetical protein [Pseudomonas sagittaria]SFP38566.1 hypothetical protein SAMN05216229_10279 [Pseudomonas sagittaria]